MAAALLAAEDDVLAGPSRDPDAPPLLLDQTPFAQEEQGSADASSTYPLLSAQNRPSEGAQAQYAESDRYSVDPFPPAPGTAEEAAHAEEEGERQEESTERRRLAAAEAVAFPPVGLDAASATIFGDDIGDAEARPAQFGEPLAEMGSGMPPAPVPAPPSPESIGARTSPLGQEGDDGPSGPAGPPPGPPPAYRASVAGSASVPPLVDLASSLQPGSDDEGDDPSHTAVDDELQ